MSISCLGCVLGWFWNFVKNFFEGHTSHPPRSAFAPPVPLINEPDYFDRFTNLLCVNLLQYRNTCFCVATSVKISVFRVHFWRGGFVYILRKWIFISTAFLPFLSFLYFLSFTAFLLFLPCLILSCFTADSCYLCLLSAGAGGVTFDTLVNVPRYHIATLPRYRVATLIVGVSSKCRRRATLFALEDLKTYHVVKLFCGRRFATLFALCVSSGGALRLKILQLLGCPPATPAADH